MLRIKHGLTKGKEDHKTFKCPNGHGQYYPQETEMEKLSRRLKSEQNCCIQAREEAQTLFKSRAIYKGMVTKLKKKLPTE